MNVCVIGTGYVGLVTGTCLSDLGHTVVCLDIDENKIASLRKGIVPIHEPVLDTVIQANVRDGRLRFSTSYAESVPGCTVVVIAVGTPAREDGQADLQYVRAAAESLSEYIDEGAVVMTKSTVPVGTGEMVRSAIGQRTSRGFSIVSCPEFLREGQAVSDFFNPDRIVIGSDDPSATETVLTLFEKITTEKLVTTLKSAELIKYASNAFLATKISFINEIANMCEMLGANVDDVAKGMGLDARIGKHFLKAGIGYGGSCFPKDVSALNQIAGGNGYDFKLLKAVIEVNNHQRDRVLDLLRKHVPDLSGKRIAVLGLAFKNNTDDIRESAAIVVVQRLLEGGATVVAFDPIAMENAKRALPEITYVQTAEEALRGADAAILATEWSAFAELDWATARSTMRMPVLIDGRNLLDPSAMKSFGFTYASIGRPS